MKTTFTRATIGKPLLIGLTVLALAGSAFGASAATGADAATPAHAQWAERAAAHRQQLHDALRLTPAQETAWNNYQAATPKRGAGQRPDRAAWKSMSAPQRLERRIAMMREHTGRMEARLAALQPLYDSLTPEQKKVFDAQGMGHGRHHGRHHGQHGGMQRGAI